MAVIILENGLFINKSFLGSISAVGRTDKSKVITVFISEERDEILDEYDYNCTVLVVGLV